MLRVLVVNHGHSAICGIYDLGLRMVALLDKSKFLAVEHAACQTLADYQQALTASAPDVVLVNYRADLMPWWNSGESPGRPVRIAIAHNYETATIGMIADGLLAAGFDHVIVLDPLLSVEHSRVHVVGRPIPNAVPVRAKPWDSPPEIGSFGFAFAHKGFDSVAREICETFDAAIYALHMPEAHFNGANGAPLYVPALLDACRQAITKSGVILRHTADHVDGSALVARLSLNDVNCLLYHPGQPDAGQSSALDWAIAARRPILVSEASMFRTGSGRVAIWPSMRLIDVFNDYDRWQRQADMLYDRHHGRFTADFETLMERIL